MQVKHVNFEDLLKGTELIEDTKFLDKVKSFYDPRRPKLEYTAEEYSRFIKLILAYHYSGQTEDQALYELGQAALEGYRKTIVGRVGLAASHLMTPKKALELGVKLMSDAYPGEYKFSDEGPRQAHISYRQAPPPSQFINGAHCVFLTTNGVEGYRTTIDQFKNTSPYLYNYDIIYQWNKP